MSDIITLSSSEDEAEIPAAKIIKLDKEATATIILSDEESEKVEERNPSQNESVDINTNIIVESAASTLEVESVEPPIDPVTSTSENEVDVVYTKLLAFIDKCKQSITLPHIQQRLMRSIPKVTGHYKKLFRANINMRDLECMLDNDSNLSYTTHKAVVRFFEIFEFLKSKLKATQEEHLIAGPKRKLLKKLETTLMAIQRKIQTYDEAEVNFDDEENSTYIKAAYYKERAEKIYLKICEIRKMDPNAGRLCYTNLKFDQSRFPKINKIINKKYKNTMEFPTYYELDKCLRKYTDAKELGISEDSFKEEIKFCFEKLGNKMKDRRKLDLYDSHTDFIQGGADPALKDKEMEKKLQESSTLSKSKMTAILEKYTRLQESGVDPNVSTDSDDSHVEDSD